MSSCVVGLHFGHLGSTCIRAGDRLPVNHRGARNSNARVWQGVGTVALTRAEGGRELSRHRLSYVQVSHA